MVSAQVIYDVVTGHSMCYGFVEMRSEDDAWRIARRMPDLNLKGHKIFVDFEVGRTMKGWKPRRLGGYHYLQYNDKLSTVKMDFWKMSFQLYYYRWWLWW